MSILDCDINTCSTQLNYRSDWDIDTIRNNFGRSDWDIDPSLHVLYPVGLGHRPEPRTLPGRIGTSTRATTDPAPRTGTCISLFFHFSYIFLKKGKEKERIRKKNATAIAQGGLHAGNACHPDPVRARDARRRLQEGNDTTGAIDVVPERDSFHLHRPWCERRPRHQPNHHGGAGEPLHGRIHRRHHGDAGIRSSKPLSAHTTTVTPTHRSAKHRHRQKPKPSRVTTQPSRRASRGHWRRRQTGVTAGPHQDGATAKPGRTRREQPSPSSRANCRWRCRAAPASAVAAGPRQSTDTRRLREAGRVSHGCRRRRPHGRAASRPRRSSPEECRSGVHTRGSGLPPSGSGHLR